VVAVGVEDAAAVGAGEDPQAAVLHGGVVHGDPGGGQPPLGLIPLTCNEVQHLFATLVPARVTDTSRRLRWSW
jgi:hypothetical protein